MLIVKCDLAYRNIFEFLLLMEKAFLIIKDKEHLKEEGLEELKKIKNSMNTNRQNN